LRRPALSILLLFVALGIADAASPPAADGVMLPRVAAPDVAQSLFHDEWRVPALRVPEDDRRPPRHVDLLREMKDLAGAQVPQQPGERDLPWTRSFGDIVRGLREARDDPGRRARMLAILRDGRPSAWKVVGPYLPALVNDDALRSDGWEAAEDLPDDGILMADPFDRSASGDPYWSKLDGTSDVYQAVTLVHAALEALKDAENDFATYPENVGADYEMIHAVQDSYLRWKDAAGHPFSVVRMVFRSDLPFPYGEFDCDLRIRTRLDDDGDLVTDVYSPSSDVYWLGGQDVVIPVYASDGAWVAMLHTRVYGFDLRGVPDGEGARVSAIVGSLGNLKRRAEARFEAAGGKPRTVRGALPDFVVRGVGPVPDDTDDD